MSFLSFFLSSSGGGGWEADEGVRPGATNSVAGLISTLVNIYSARDGKLSVTARVTVAVTAGCSLVFGALFVVHQLLLMRVKRMHARVMEADEKRARRVGGQDEPGVLENLKRKAQEPAAMPGGVV